MEKEKKKKKRKYVKPKVTRIVLESKTAVLAVCKAPGVGFGPRNVNCRGAVGGICRDHGS